MKDEFYYYQCHQKQYRQCEDQHNKNNLKTKMGRKTAGWILQMTNNWNFTEANLDMAKKEKPETESLLIVAQNNTIRTNYMKVRIDKSKSASIVKALFSIATTQRHKGGHYSLDFPTLPLIYTL